MGKELRALGSSKSVCILEIPALSEVRKPVGGPCHGSGEIHRQDGGEEGNHLQNNVA